MEQSQLTGNQAQQDNWRLPRMSPRLALLRACQIAIDGCVLSAAIWLGFFFRFDWNVPRDMFASLITLWPYVVAVEYAALFAIGVPRYLWRYTGLREVTGILLATGLSTFLLTFVRTLLGVIDLGYAAPARLPYGVIAINCTLAFLAVAGVRIIRRVISEKFEATSRRPAIIKRAIPTLLIGAGQGGVSVAKEIQTRPEMGIRPVGFLDDNTDKRGTLVHGIAVLGKIEAIATIAPRVGAEQVLITISNAHGPEVRRISELCSHAGLRVRFVPRIQDLVEGRTHRFGIRDVLIEDLLRRAPIELNTLAIAESIEGKTVLITGAGGSIGSELCRQVMTFDPKQLVLIERSENALFEVHRELVASYPGRQLEACIADVGDDVRIAQLLEKYRPQVIFHAAAHKHVPMMEANPVEAVKNNVLATCRLADAAAEAKVSTFVMVSTDKAVRATSVMGATKRAAEIYIQAKAATSSTDFVTVRFGNVLGSTGSVVPIFKQQIAAGGPITITHPDMQRYFMTIPEASQLVLQAGTMGVGGEIFILDMGDPVKIVDLARDLVRLSGLQESDIAIEFLGIRPGEKLFEELCGDDDDADRTVHPKITVARNKPVELLQLQKQIQSLSVAVTEASPVTVLTLLRSLVRDYQPERKDDVKPPTSSRHCPLSSMSSQ